MTSRPLFISVDESTVIFGPIDHVGWASASSTVTSASDAGARPRNGPPLAVSTRRASSDGPAAAQALVDGAVLGVDRAGSRPRACRARRRPPGPPAMSDSLLASARRFPAARAASVTGSPAKPTTPLTATSATPAMRRQRVGPGPQLDPGGQQVLQRRRAAVVGEGDDRGAELLGLGGQQLDGSSRAERHDLEPAGRGPHDVERLRADRPGRADQ